MILVAQRGRAAIAGPDLALAMRASVSGSRESAAERRNSFAQGASPGFAASLFPPSVPLSRSRERGLGVRARPDPGFSPWAMVFRPFRPLVTALKSDSVIKRTLRYNHASPDFGVTLPQAPFLRPELATVKDAHPATL